MLTNNNFYIGDSSVSRLYQGETLVWDASRPDILLSYIANGPDGETGQKSVWFNTGVTTDASTRIEIKGAAYNTTSQTWLAGEINTTSWGGLVFYMSYPSSSAGPTYARIGSVSVSNGNLPYESNQIVTMSAYLDLSDKNQYNQYRPVFIYDGSTYYGNSYTASTGNGQLIYLLTRNRNAGEIGGSPSGLKMYYCKIWDNNNLIRFYIPVLHYINGQYTPCFYDKVNNTYIYNLGTDTPTYKISGDYLLDYIGSGPENAIPDNRQVVMRYDSGVVASNQLQTDMRGRLVWGRENYLFGSATSGQTTPTWQPFGLQTTGGTTDADKMRLRMGFGASSTSNYGIYLSTDASTVVGVNTLSTYYDANRGYAYLNGTRSNTSSPVPDTFSSNTIHLFSRHGDATNINALGGSRIYYINFTTSNIPTKTYVPVLHNNQAAFLDLNSNTYIYNLGTDTPVYSFQK